MMGLGYLVLLPLNLIPAAGSAAWLFASTVWAAFWLTVEHLSNPMARHLTPFRQVLRVATGRLALSLGFGLSLWIVLWVPVVNCLVMPLAVVSGTLLFRGLGNVAARPRVGLP
jgi:CysZ protein